MPARPIASATLAWGLVNVPVKLYSSSESSASVSFNMVHKTCGTRVKQQYICPKDEKVVEKDEIVKGFEFAKGQYVIFTPEEVKALEEKATNSISIEEFVPLAEVDRIYLEKVYYLGPDKGGDRAYRLMCEALKETKRAAIGQYAARGQEHLVLVRPKDGVLIMEQLHYNAELRPSSEVPIGEGDVKPAELTLAKQLIEQAAVDEFHPERYKDKVQGRVMEAIQQKVEGQEIVAEPQQETGAKIIDLMEALKASLGKSGGKAAAKASKADEEVEEEKPAKKKATRKKAG